MKSKTELAWQYSPEASQTTALHRLSRWIKGDSELYGKLTKAGYRDNQRLLTPQQVTIIYEYLGEPTEFVR